MSQHRCCCPGGGGNIPGCVCSSVPASITMAVANESGNAGILRTCTLAYGPTPAALLTLGLGADSYLSTAQFTDTATGDLFWHYLGCYIGYYIITRVYATSAYGSPYRDVIRYRWLPVASGNTCTPFAQTNGQIFPGGDPVAGATTLS